MDTDAMVSWLREEAGICDAKTMKAVKDAGLTGKQLIRMDIDALQEIVSKRSRCELIIDERDEYIEREDSKFPVASETPVKEFDVSGLVQPYRIFDSSVDVVEMYQQYSRFPDTPTRPTDLIEPIRRFVALETIDIKGPSFITLVEEVIRFGAACLNDSTNGVIYFGVKEGEILGLDVTCDKTLLDEMLTQKIKRSFHESQWSKVVKCIRPIRWVQVRTKVGPAIRYVIEVDVEPTSVFCGEDVFLVKPGNNLFTFDDSGPRMLNKDKFPSFFIEKPKLAIRRKDKESFKNTEKVFVAHKQDLVNVLCRGRTKIREGEYPILVLPPADICLTQEIIESNFSFLGHIDWKAVFDFGADRNFLEYMNSQDRLFKIRDVEEFDTESEDSTSVKNTLEDAYNGHVPNWILMNGDFARDRKPEDLTPWKKHREDACRSCFKTYMKGFKSSRVLVVLLLHSQSTDVFIDACAQLCVQSENYACIAENENIAKTWQAGLLKYHYVEKNDIERRVVAGLPWGLVGETVREITDNEPHAMCKVPTSIGDQILTIKKDLYDLSVVGSNECDNSEIVENPAKLNEFLKVKEAEFYKGGKVDWWNFWSEGVCRRDIFSPLYNKVRSALTDKVVVGEIEQGIKTHTLYHQPGSGGTTCARHILWELRKVVKCAEVVHLSDYTCSQIVKLREFGETIRKDPSPVLLLIDNADQDKTLELLTQLKKKSEMRDRSATTKAFCVCLIVDRRSNLSSSAMGKHEPFDCLRQHLSRHERVLFEKQNDKIQEKHETKTLIAFNIMKANFDPGFIKENVAFLIKDITSHEELFLLKYLAFINFYDISQKAVECSAFDEVMTAKEDERGEAQVLYSQSRSGSHPQWETDLSEALDVLVIQEYSDSGHKAIKISHHKLSEQILENMKEESLLSQFAIKLLSHRFLKNKVSYATMNLRRHLAGIVKQRGAHVKGYRERFAPLILQIKKEETWQAAATVMETVYQLTEDAFVAQQLARLYIDSESWESAGEYASMATEKHPENYHLLDTKGQVFRHKLEKHYKTNSMMTQNSPVKVSSILNKVSEAYKATGIFKEVQDLSYSLTLRNPTAKPTTSGQLGKLQIYASILENVSLLPEFKQESTGNTSKTLMKFLHDPHFVPRSLKSWTANTERDYISFLKGIPQDAKETLRYVEDFHSHLNQGFLKSKDSELEGAISREKVATKGLKDRLYNYILNTEGGEAASDKQPIPRDVIWLLGGTSFNNILHRLGLDTEQEQDLSALDPIATLRTLLHNAKECIQKKLNDYEALECLISVSLIVSLYFADSDLAAQVTLPDLLKWSKTLYAIRNSKSMRLEPYLYYVMLHWPKVGDSEGQRSISEAIMSWKELYLRKNPNMLANHAFYITKETGIKSFAHRSQLYNHKRHRGDNFWKDKDVKQKLKRFTGTLDGKGSSVFLLDENTRETILTIPTAYPIHDSSLWRNAVTFPIAFTFMGPKAYDVQRK